jgi:hypothetical protein
MQRAPLMVLRAAISHLYTENIDLNSVSILRILARGSSSGQGQSSPSSIAAPGTNGNDGGLVNILVGTFMGYLIDQFVSSFTSPLPAATPIYKYGGFAKDRIPELRLRPLFQSTCPI